MRLLLFILFAPSFQSILGMSLVRVYYGFFIFVECLFVFRYLKVAKFSWLMLIMLIYGGGIFVFYPSLYNYLLSGSSLYLSYLILAFQPVLTLFLARGLFSRLRLSTLQYLIAFSTIILILQLLPITRSLFMLPFSNYQAVLSESIYSRSTGLANSFYTATQVQVLSILLWSAYSNKPTKALVLNWKSIVLMMTSVASNARSAFMVPLCIVLAYSSKKVRLILSFCFVGIVLYLCYNYVPFIRLYTYLEKDSLSAVLEGIQSSRLSSIAQRVEDFNLFCSQLTVWTFLWGGNAFSGQELGVLRTLSSIGVFGLIYVYFSPFLICAQISSRYYCNVDYTRLAMTYTPFLLPELFSNTFINFQYYSFFCLVVFLLSYKGVFRATW